MISHVLGKAQGYPVGSKMPGVFNTVEDLLRAFVRDYKPRSSKPELGKVPEQELMLLVFTDKELNQMMHETSSGFSTFAINKMSSRINQSFGFSKGFREALIRNEVLGPLNGMIFCPESLDWPDPRIQFETGPTMNEDRERTTYAAYASY